MSLEEMSVQIQAASRLGGSIDNLTSTLQPLMNQFATPRSNLSNAISSNDQFIAPNTILSNNAMPNTK